MQSIANQLPDEFTNNKKIIKFHISTANTLARIEVLVGQSINTSANESKPRLKHGRPVRAKDKIPRKRKMQEKQVVAPKEAIPMKQAIEINNISKIHNSPEKNPLKITLLKRSHLKGYPLKRIRYLKIMRFQ